MTASGGTAPKAVQLVEDMPATGPVDGLDLVRWFAGTYDKPFSEPAIRARLPQGVKLSEPNALARALSAIGLKSRLVRRDPARLDPGVLPCVVLPRSGAPLILTALDRRARSAVLVDPENGNLESEISLRELRRRVQRRIMLVTRAEDIAASRTGKGQDSRRSHWFWGAVRANGSNWAQVMLAALCLNILSLALPLFVMNVYDKVIPNLAFVTLWTLALGVALALGLDLMLRLLRNGLLDRIGSHVDLAVGSNLFAHAMNVRLLDRPGGAAGIAATIRDFENVREFFASATFVAIIDFLFIGIFVAVLYWLVGPIAIVPLVALPVVMVLALIAQMPIGRSADRAQQMATKRQIVLVETLTGIETVKSLNAEPVMQREWENAISESARVNARVRRWSAVASNGTMLIQQAVSVTIIVWGVFLVSEGRISIGGLIAANILAARILTPLGMIAQTIFRAHYAFKSLQALSGFMDLPTEQDPSVSHDLKVTKGAVQVQDVTLTYPDARFPALNALSLKVAPAEIVVLLGKVGSGKSTLGKLLCGLIRPDSGNVTVDGVALDQYDPAELRGGVGYLPQSPELFTGTLRENLVIGASGASDQQVMKALYFAGMEGFVADSPDGLDFFVGEKGGRLSGGQQQSIALARLILRRPKLMFLDEPTNAMDQSMEALVVSRLQELNQKGTGLIISTHRQSLAAAADRLVVLDKGRAVLDGPRLEVMGRLHALGAERAKV